MCFSLCHFGFWILDFGFWILDYKSLAVYSTSGSYEVQLRLAIGNYTPYPSPLIPFLANSVPHSSRKCCMESDNLTYAIYLVLIS
jgi:hypothetical protein